MESGTKSALEETTAACSGTLFDEKLAAECLLDDERLCMEYDFSDGSSRAGFDGAAPAPKPVRGCRNFSLG